MDNAPPTVAFDFTPEDLADVTVRYAAGTAAGRRMRRQCIWAFGIVTAMGSLLGFVLLSGARDAVSLLGMTLTALIIGVVSARFQAMNYDAALTKRALRSLVDQIGAGTMRCDVVLRPEGPWVRQRNVEITYAWKDLVSLNDVETGIELRFRDGYLLVRSRAFATSADREAFVAAIRTFAHDAGVRGIS